MDSHLHAKTLIEIADTLSASVEFEDLLHEVMGRTVELTGAALSLILVTGNDDRVFYVLGSSEDPTALKLPVERSMYPEVSQAIEEAREIVVAVEDEGGPAAGILQQREISSVWALPLVWKGQVYGVFELAFAGEPALEDGTRDLVRHARSLIAFSLRGSELYASLHEQTRKRATGDLQSQRLTALLEQYEEFFQRAFDGILVLDGEFRVLHINPAGEQITGYARHGLVGTYLRDIVIEGDRDGLNALLEQTRAGTSYSFDLGLVTTSGDSIQVTLSPSAVLAEDEVFVLSFRDVTESRALENELRSTKEFLERLIDSASDAIVATDINGQVILFNKGAERLFKMQAVDVVGNLYLEDLYPSGESEKVMEELRGPDGGGIGRLKAVRKEVLNDNQERVPILLSANLIYEDGREVGTVGIIGDLRDRLRIEQRLAQAQEKLVETEKQALIAELAGTTAHELNQPLTSVMGYAELLKRRSRPDEGSARAIETILHEAERMAEIVRKIGKITRYETKTYVGGTQILDLDKSSKE